MSEQVTLTAPITKPNQTLWALAEFTISLRHNIIRISLQGNNGEGKGVVYDASTTPTAKALLTALNTSNNSAGTSMIKRIFNQLIANGHISGTVGGAPD